MDNTTGTEAQGKRRRERKQKFTIKHDESSNLCISSEATNIFPKNMNDPRNEPSKSHYTLTLSSNNELQCQQINDPARVNNDLINFNVISLPLAREKKLQVETPCSNPKKRKQKFEIPMNDPEISVDTDEVCHMHDVAEDIVTNKPIITNITILPRNKITILPINKKQIQHSSKKIKNTRWPIPTDISVPTQSSCLELSNEFEYNQFVHSYSVENEVLPMQQPNAKSPQHDHTYYQKTLKSIPNKISKKIPLYHKDSHTYSQLDHTYFDRPIEHQNFSPISTTRT